MAPGTSGADIQALINASGPGTVIVLPPEVISVFGGFTISNPGITIILSNGTVIQASSPCFTVTANDTTITSATFLGGKCIPSGSDHGILTGAAVNNLVIRGVEIDGSASTGDGIHIGHAVTNLQILDNYIHNMRGSGAGVHYTAAGIVWGVHEVQGNLLKDNLGAGVNNESAGTYDVSSTVGGMWRVQQAVTA